MDFSLMDIGSHWRISNKKKIFVLLCGKWMVGELRRSMEMSQKAVVIFLYTEPGR